MKVPILFLDLFVLGLGVVKERLGEPDLPQAGHGGRLVLGLASPHWSPPGPLFLLGARVGAAAAASIHSACLREKSREGWDMNPRLLSKSYIPHLGSSKQIRITFPIGGGAKERPLLVSQNTPPPLESAPLPPPPL